MKRYLNFFLLSFFFLFGCSNVPSTDEINGDITTLEAEIKDANDTVQQYSGGLLAVLANVRLETLKSTKSMLEQKKKGFQRYILLKYTFDGKEYTPPANKDALLLELNSDLENLQKELSIAQIESSKYGSGLLGVLSLTQVATVKNSIAFLNQRQLLLKHNIPYYSIVPAPSGSKEPSFKPTPGEDINKF